MDLIENTTKELDFTEGFEALSAKNQKKVKVALMQKCEWSNMTFYNKLRGIYRVKFPESRVIEDVFSGFGVNAWTGQRINGHE
jgi:hypothetical protein